MFKLQSSDCAEVLDRDVENTARAFKNTVYGTKDQSVVDWGIVIGVYTVIGRDIKDLKKINDVLDYLGELAILDRPGLIRKFQQLSSFIYDIFKVSDTGCFLTSIGIYDVFPPDVIKEINEHRKEFDKIRRLTETLVVSAKGE